MPPEPIRGLWLVKLKFIRLVYRISNKKRGASIGGSSTNKGFNITNLIPLSFAFYNASPELFSETESWLIREQ